MSVLLTGVRIERQGLSGESGERKEETGRECGWAKTEGVEVDSGAE